jgi:ferric iron reductase protein FhuF
VSNYSFYNHLIGQRNYYFFYRTSSQTFITNVTVTIIPNKEVKDDLNGELVWENTVKWIDNKFELQIDTPDGVFDDCFTPA